VQGYNQGGTSLGTAPGVAQVPVPGQPGGVTPNLTQYPTAPPHGFTAPMAQGYPSQQGAPPMLTGPYTQPSPTYGSNVPAGFPVPSYMPTPGPATLGPAQSNAPTTGGVAGVSMAPIGGVTPPSTAGGPHVLPSLPQVPLPQGFPNPFQVSQVGPSQAPQQATPYGPGSSTQTGPNGYFPGIGQIGMPQQGVPQGMPQSAWAGGMPSQGAQPGWAPSTPGPHALPSFPWGAQAPTPAHGQTQTGPAATAAPQQSHPYWVQLAWQLMQTPAVKSTLGHRLTQLLADEHRMKAITVAAQCLAGPDMQAAFRAMTAGSLQQAKFTESFAAALRTALDASGL
jgi:hypothetical protein